MISGSNYGKGSKKEMLGNNKSNCGTVKELLPTDISAGIT